MKKYGKIGFGIETQLPETDFFIRANILCKDRSDNEYDVAFELGQDGISRWDMMDEQHYTVYSENINTDVYEMILSKYKNGDFNHFIELFEFETECINKGIEYYEARHELFFDKNTGEEVELWQGADDE